MIAALLAALAAATVLPVAPSSPASAAPPCGQGSWVAGSVDLCAGELVYRDYVYDDFGAGPPVGSDLPIFHFSSYPTFDAYGGLPPTGVERYPAGETDTADLVSLRIRLDGGDVRVTAELNAMFDAGSTILALALDTDDDTATGGGAWPGVSGVSSAGWDEVHTFGTGDPAANTIVGSFPEPAGGTWRIQAVTARSDGTVMNVAFRGLDEAGFWWDDHQAAALAAGDISAFGTTVTVADLAGGVTRPADVPPGAVRQRVYISQHPLGEGVDMAGVPGPGHTGGTAAAVSQAFNFLGRYQPYGFYLPAAAGPHGAELLLHGLAENHSARFFLPGVAGNITADIGDARNRILISPLGRGWKNWWSSYGERDAFDALADVEASYPVDPDQVYVSGYSMGGYGTLRMAALHPDLFAGFIDWVGWTGDEFNGTPFGGAGTEQGSGGGAVGNAIDFVGNLRHVPGAALYSGADELVTVQQAVALRDQLAAHAIPSIFYLHPVADHLTYAEFDNWQKESDYTAGFALVHDPTHVTFRTDRRLYLPEVAPVPDRAYWLSAIVPAADGYADLDGLSGCAGVEPVTEERTGAGPSPVPWVSTEIAVTGATPIPAGNRLQLTLANVASLTVDAGGACLAGAPVAYDVTTDGPVTITLTDGRVLPIGGAGHHTGTLALSGGSASTTATTAPVQGHPGDLPATGGRSSALLAVGAILLALALLVRASRLGVR